jgi:hypothetical protein
MPQSPSGAYNKNALIFNMVDGTSGFLAKRPDTESGNKNAILSFYEPNFTLSSGADNSPSLTFESGNYNFYDPDNASAYTGNSVTLLKNLHCTFLPGTLVRLPDLTMYNSSTLSILGKCEVYDKATISDSARFIASGAEITFSADVNVLSGASMLATSGAVVRCLTAISVHGTNTPTLVVSNSTFDASAANMYIGYANDGIVRLVSGEMSIFGKEGVCVATTGGNGTLELIDGKLSVARIRLSRSTADSSKSAVFHQKGGVFTADTTIQFQQ